VTKVGISNRRRAAGAMALWLLTTLLFALAVAIPEHHAVAAGDPERGAQAFQACAACHSLRLELNMTGPSLAGVWGRKAGSLAGFDRYSPALKESGVIWDAKALVPWLKSPEQFIPGNWMTFAGIPDAETRADLIAFLKEASVGQMPAAGAEGSGMGGGMMGGMAPRFTDLKKVGPDRQVRSIRSCRDSYFVTTADGRTRAFWDHSLRFETDASSVGPASGAPAMLPAGMMGDRATVIFAAPEEISAFIKHEC
jgi:cytochrome c